MKFIPLTLGKYTIVDDEDYVILSKHKWYANKDHDFDNYYVVRGIRIKGKRKKEKMHRIIMNPPVGMEVDHINGNGLDNRRENLRIVTSHQNHQNRHVQKTSQYVGVHWHKSHKKWATEIQYKGKIKWLGDYHNEIEAATVYQVAYAVLIENK
jgi:hypothetical protein